MMEKDSLIRLFKIWHYDQHKLLIISASLPKSFLIESISEYIFTFREWNIFNNNLFEILMV